MTVSFKKFDNLHLCLSMKVGVNFWNSQHVRQTWHFEKLCKYRPRYEQTCQVINGVVEACPCSWSKANKLTSFVSFTFPVYMTWTRAIRMSAAELLSSLPSQIVWLCKASLLLSGAEMLSKSQDECRLHIARREAIKSLNQVSLSTFMHLLHLDFVSKVYHASFSLALTLHSNLLPADLCRLSNPTRCPKPITHLAHTEISY